MANLTDKQKEAWAALEKAANFTDRQKGWEAAITFARAMAPPPPKQQSQQRNSPRSDKRSLYGGGGGRSSGGKAHGHGGRETRSGVVCPFGKNQGVPIEELDEKDLEFLIKVFSESIDNPEKQRFRAKNLEQLAACERELATR